MSNYDSDNTCIKHESAIISV